MEHDCSFLSTKLYEYVAPNGGNNGQISKIRFYTAPGVEDLTKTEVFQYDAWSRLANAQTQDTNPALPNTWALTWQYDRYGNRRTQTLTAGSQSVTQPQLQISTATNRITDATFAYDNAGNLTNDSIHTYAYDAENRIKTMDSTVASYGYDNGGLRLKKITSANTTTYLYSGTKVIAEYLNGSLSKEYIYAGSQLLGTIAGSSTTYSYSDHLSVRARADGSGNPLGTSGHLPFGEVWYETGTADKWKFTSYERDGESLLDYAIFRYDSTRLGRFMSPDPLPGNTLNPQSLNRYGYVLNDPANLVDPLGLEDGPPGILGSHLHLFGGIIRCSVVSEQVDFVSVADRGGDGANGRITSRSLERMRCELVPMSGPLDEAESFRKRREQKQLQNLKDCLREIYNITLRNFVPVAPNSDGYFYGADDKGRDIVVDTNVTHSSWDLVRINTRPWQGPMNGWTPNDSDPRQKNFVSSDGLAAMYNPDSIYPVQLHELGHSLDMITSGNPFGSSEPSADRLPNCVRTK
ncbi:MAG: RHS repeat-associated core domain-containing protein [Acidobacteriales bacterium]|nr:RHS repeat-associated core domain-containing protein [Terriglobales bacterium]